MFQHDITDRDFKDLAKRTGSEKSLRDKAFNIAKNQKYDRYQKGLASVVDKFFDKKSSGSGANNKIKQNEELDKPIIRKYIKRRVYSSFKDNTWGADLADMQFINKLNKGARVLWCLIDIFSKYAWFVSLKNKKDL